MTDPHLTQILTEGDLHLEGEFVWGSNYTFLVRAVHPAGERLAVYKPTRGERPLWDFPEGSLAAREVAAYRVSRALGWDLVPTTILRPDGPTGPGSLQAYLELDFEHHYFAFSDDEKQRLRPAAAFDLLVNNADRKAGHILFSPDGHLWLIDHGICFHIDDKLRTVIWDFAGEPIPEALLADVDRVGGALTGPSPLRDAVEGLLDPDEIDALHRRASIVVERGVFPHPGPDRPFPWPLV